MYFHFIDKTIWKLHIIISVENHGDKIITNSTKLGYLHSSIDERSENDPVWRECLISVKEVWYWNNKYSKCNLPLCYFCLNSCGISLKLITIQLSPITAIPSISILNWCQLDMTALNGSDRFLQDYSYTCEVKSSMEIFDLLQFQGIIHWHYILLDF